MTKEDLLDVALKVIGAWWFLNSIFRLMHVLLYLLRSKNPAMHYGSVEDSFAIGIGPAVIMFVLSLFVMVQSGTIVNLLYGRRSARSLRDEKQGE